MIYDVVHAINKAPSRTRMFWLCCKIPDSIGKQPNMVSGRTIYYDNDKQLNNNWEMAKESFYRYQTIDPKDNHDYFIGELGTIELSQEDLEELIYADLVEKYPEVEL